MTNTWSSVLVDIVSMFPLGSLIKLNNNEIGRVIRPVASTPPARCRELLLDERRRPAKEGTSLNLIEEPMLYVIDPAIEEKGVQKALDQHSAPN